MSVDADDIYDYPSINHELANQPGKVAELTKVFEKTLTQPIVLKPTKPPKPDLLPEKKSKLIIDIDKSSLPDMDEMKKKLKPVTDKADEQQPRPAEDISPNRTEAPAQPAERTSPDPEASEERDVSDELPVRVNSIYPPKRTRETGNLLSSVLSSPEGNFRRLPLPTLPSEDVAPSKPDMIHVDPEWFENRHFMDFESSQIYDDIIH